jgi:hypothetical protein
MEDFDDKPIPLHARAMDNLSFIREAMERSEPFTGISGKGMVVMGLLALGGGHVARMHLSRDWWIYTWLAVAVAGCAVGLVSMYWKMRAQDRPGVVRATRRFVMNVAPAILAGIFLTEMFYELGLNAFMPGLWLLLYGTGVVAGGALSVKVLPVMGALLMFLGAFALFWALWGAQSFSVADAAGEAALALGFGGLHILTGLMVNRRYGG